jgi:hypothetical protein
MRSPCVVVGEGLSEDPLEMPLVDHDRVIDAVASPENAPLFEVI